ncbi:N-acetyltransferase [bacterium]|nr:N-acetyltransferase [bacterium]
MRIESHRVNIREFSESDWIQIQEYACDYEVVKYETWGPNTEAQTKEFLSYAIKARQESPRQVYEFAVVLRDTGALIGACGIRIKDKANRAGDIGYTLRKDHWGQGLGTEVAKALVQFGFNQLKLHRIWATCHVNNKASARVLEKAGMQREGILRKNILQRGEWRDSYLYAVLETDD